MICRAMCDLFNHPALQGKLAFRGGTAINKLLFGKPLRYSEDIDLVQTQSGPIGGIIDGVRDALSWLGKCNRDQAPHTTHLVFKFSPETGGGLLKLRIEINTREHQNLHGLKTYPFEVSGDWHHATADIVSSEPEELFGTKLRACSNGTRTAIYSTSTRDCSNLAWTEINCLRASTIISSRKAIRSAGRTPRSECS